MKEILVRGDKKELYDEILNNYCLGYYKEISEYNIIYSEDGVNMIPVCAKEYMDKFTKEQGNHRVYDIKKKNG